MQALDAIVKPLLEAFSPLSLRQKQNAEPHLAQDDRIDDDILLVTPKPVDDVRVRRRLGDLAQHVRVDQELHSVSVDSDSMGTKKSFSGQARSQSTNPSLAFVGRRTSR